MEMAGFRERTLVLIKPDGVQRGLVGEILARLERKGLKIVGLKMVWMSRELAERHYEIHRGKDFFEKLVNYITSGPLVAAVLEGPQAVEVVRNLVGATDPVKALPGTIRGDFGLSIGRNLIHASDSPEAASREIELFFSSDELFSYRRDIEGWIAEAEL